MRTAIALVLLVSALAGCSRERPAASGEPDVTGATSLDLAALAHATVTGIYDDPVTLENGEYTGPPYVEGSPMAPRLLWNREIVHLADVDQDGTTDGITFYTAATGGSGVLLYLVWLEPTPAGAHTRAVELLGDRVQIRSATLETGLLRLELIVAGPNDGACCPTQMEQRVYAFGRDGIEEASRAVIGTASLDVLAGTSWTLERMAYESRPVTAAAVTLRFLEGGVSGSAGCNTYRGSVRAGDSKQIAFGPLVTTKMACPPPIAAVENDFLTRMAAVDGWSFFMGRLALSYSVEGTRGSLLFDPIDFP